MNETETDPSNSDGAAGEDSLGLRDGPASSHALVMAEPTDTMPALLPEEIARARRYAAASRAASTCIKYKAAWSTFVCWARENGHDVVPAHPGVVAVYLTAGAERGLSPSTIGLQLAAIAWAHRRGGRQPPQKTELGILLVDIMAGIRREHGTPPRRKQAADADVLRDILRAIDGDGLRAVRDRALLAFGMASCLRRSELTALRLEDLERTPDGLRVTIRRSKGDQEGKGATIGVPNGARLQPVGQLDAWLAAAGITGGYVFRRLSNDGRRVQDSPMSDRGVARVVQARAEKAGYDPTRFSGHSLRSGFLTSAARARASIWKMREQSRHKSIQVLGGYVQSVALFDDHAGRDFL